MRQYCNHPHLLSTALSPDVLADDLQTNASMAMGSLSIEANTGASHNADADDAVNDSFDEFVTAISRLSLDDSFDEFVTAISRLSLEDNTAASVSITQSRSQCIFTIIFA